ncbi:MAG: tRNA (N6-threonylcarbamoyladenosine(37)-N6)-methyltransferase TrmO [Lachnospiraceae bacterium]|nr:tRNA (N6-threonylcarbamoyladenosine(37)-N6)-methyltransferase TrmO [Lachnospiraceae bacterium]
MELEVIAKMHSPMTEKFGLPRQSGLAESLPGTITFLDKYSDERAVEGLEEYDYIWILWQFEDVDEKKGSFRAQVRPPRLGGNTYKGVFATRSPFRPNPIGMSLVKLERIEITDKGPVLHVLGADIRDGTPIFDIKPYLPYTEAHPEARGGFTDYTKDRKLKVTFKTDGYDKYREEITELLSQDPRPAYHDDPDRIYGMKYREYDVKFKVVGDEVIVL